MKPTESLERLQPYSLEELRQAFAGYELPYSDDEPMDSEWHRTQISLLVESVRTHFIGRDFYAGGNMFTYYSVEQIRNNDFRGPDFFFVWGRPMLPPRNYWAVWEEDGHYPNVIVELTSPTTEEVDRGAKVAIYEQMFRTAEYYICDPYAKTLDGSRLDAEGRYQPIEPDEHGRLWCEHLNLSLGWLDCVYQCLPADWLRFFTADGHLVKVASDRIQEHRKRAEAAEAEIARLRALLAATKPPLNGH